MEEVQSGRGVKVCSEEKQQSPAETSSEFGPVLRQKKRKENSGRLNVFSIFAGQTSARCETYGGKLQESAVRKAGQRTAVRKIWSRQ